jgi:hypothetical protein
MDAATDGGGGQDKLPGSDAGADKTPPDAAPDTPAADAAPETLAADVPAPPPDAPAAAS